VRHWRITGALAALAIVCAGKQYYRDATAGELGWLIAPVARMTGWVTGHHFGYVTDVGWVSRGAAFVIAPVCAGLNFALAAFLALAIVWLPAMRSAGAVVARLAAAAGVAYLATLAVNTVRIALAVELHLGPTAHELLGIAVYLGGLCALVALARRRHARAG